MNIQPKQNSILHGLLTSTGLMAQKRNLILGFTDGRTESSKDMTYQEAGALITHLKSLDASHKMRRRIIKMAHEMGWHLPGTQKIDMDAINEWCKKYGAYHKPLNDHSATELPRLVTQFEFGPYKHYLSHL